MAATRRRKETPVQAGQAARPGPEPGPEPVPGPGPGLGPGLFAVADSRQTSRASRPHQIRLPRNTVRCNRLTVQNAGKHVRGYSGLHGLKGVFLSKYQAWTYCHAFELLFPVCPAVQAVQLAELGGQLGEKNGCPGNARPGSHLRNTTGNVVFVAYSATLLRDAFEPSLVSWFRLKLSLSI